MINIKDKETGNIKTFTTIGDFIDFINPIAERQGLEITVDNQNHINRCEYCQSPLRKNPETNKYY